MDEDIGGPEAVRGDGRVKVEDPASPVGAGVRQDLDELVRGKGGHVAQRAVLEGQDVALGPEGVVGGPDSGSPVNSGRRTRDPRRFRSGTEPPDVEIAPALLEGRDGEEDLGQAAGVLLEFAALAGRVTVPQDQEVHLFGRIAVFLDCEERTRRRGQTVVHEHGFRVHGRRPDFAEDILRVAFLERDTHRLEL